VKLVPFPVLHDSGISAPAQSELFDVAMNFMATQTLRISRNSMFERLAVLWARVRRMSARTPKRLRLCESLPLGERRFVAVVEFENERFLLGATGTSLTLLSRLESAGGDQGKTEGADS
jgi:flagellar biogenesis protein FliO